MNISSKDRIWNILLFLATGFLFLGCWVDKKIYFLTIPLVIGSIFRLKKRTFSSPGFLSFGSFSWVLVWYLIGNLIKWEYKEVAGIWTLCMFVGFLILAIYVGKRRGWLGASFFLLPEAVLWSQFELMEPTAITIREVVSTGAIYMAIIFVIGSGIAMLIKRARNCLLFLIIMVILGNGVNCFINAYNCVYGTFWGNFSFTTRWTIGFGLILISVPKIIDFLGKQMKKQEL